MSIQEEVDTVIEYLEANGIITAVVFTRADDHQNQPGIAPG